MKRVEIIKCSERFDLELVDIASDKSISHRSVIFSLLSDRPSKIGNFLLGEDTLASLSIAEQLGAKVEKNGADIEIVPPKRLSEPEIFWIVKMRVRE